MLACGVAMLTSSQVLGVTTPKVKRLQAESRTRLKASPRSKAEATPRENVTVSTKTNLFPTRLRCLREFTFPKPNVFHRYEVHLDPSAAIHQSFHFSDIPKINSVTVVPFEINHGRDLVTDGHTKRCLFFLQAVAGRLHRR